MMGKTSSKVKYDEVGRIYSHPIGLCTDTTLLNDVRGYFLLCSYIDPPLCTIILIDKI